MFSGLYKVKRKKLDVIDEIWQCWSNYVDGNNLTGGNEKFIEIIEVEGADYITRNFKYSIYRNI